MNVNSILVIRYSGLGDIVMLLQTLKKLKKKYNNPEITLLTDYSNIGILDNTCGTINKIIPINRTVFKEKKIYLLLKELKNLFINLRKKRYDLLIDFQNFGETATISYLAKATKKIGAPKKDKYNYGYTQIVKRDMKGHRSQFFSRIAGVDSSLDFSKLCLEENGNLHKYSLLKKLDKNKKTVGLNIGSTQDNRRWNECNFYSLAKKLEAQYNILVFIGPAEKRFQYVFKDLYTIKDISLQQLISSISVCNYFVTNDTGPAHIAAALNIPTLTLFSTGSDENVGTLIKNKVHIQKTNINDISLKEVLKKFNFLTNKSHARY